MKRNLIYGVMHLMMYLLIAAAICCILSTPMDDSPRWGTELLRSQLIGWGCVASACGLDKVMKFHGIDVFRRNDMDM